jgi:hypothetical protein
MSRELPTRMRIQYTLSDTDIADITLLLNVFLEHVSLVSLSRREVGLADPNRLCRSTSPGRHSDIAKLVNRWGIRNEDGKYHALLNEVIGRIASCNRMLIIYKPIELLLFNKMLDGAKFTQEEIQLFFLQPYEMIISESIRFSALHLHSLIMKLMDISQQLRCESAKEFLHQGVGRRLFMLKACVDSISTIYSEHRTQPIDEGEAAVLSQNINFFYANLFAIVDCIAFVFAYEDPGYAIDRTRRADLKKVGLFNREFRAEIGKLSKWADLPKVKVWYDAIVDLRHPVAHRIPLYFPDIYTDDDSLAIQQIYQEYYGNLRLIFRDTTIPPDDMTRKLDTLQEEWKKKKASIDVFSGCFLHSHAESKRYYHLSRLSLDLGILYYLLDTSFDRLGGGGTAGH